MNEVDSTNQESTGLKLKTAKKVSQAGIVGTPKLNTQRKRAKKMIFRKG